MLAGKPSHTRKPETTMDIAPVIQRLHPELDCQQREVIAHAGGPLLVIAGPGAGKTRCVALRAVNLLLTGQCPPGELVLCTFGRDTALELRRRFTQAARDCGVQGDPSRVGLSTIHSLCHRILASCPEITGLRPGYGLLNESEQQMLMHREFDAVFGPDRDILSGRGWGDGVHTVTEAARYFDRICDELIDPLDLARSPRPLVAAMGRCLRRYRQLLLDHNSVDFAHLQVWTERVLRQDDIAARTGGDIRHLMVDEFQDISRVQMRILGRLAMVHGNIAVVGDDDQSVYRFPGRQRGQPAGVPPPVSRQPGAQADHQLPLPPGHRLSCRPVDGRRRTVGGRRPGIPLRQGHRAPRAGRPTRAIPRSSPCGGRTPRARQGSSGSCSGS